MAEVSIFKGPPLNSYKIPDYKYFPTDLMEKEGPKHWAKLRLLQAYERLNIPSNRWPKFPDLCLPHEYGMGYHPAGGISVLPFHPLYETEAEWRRRCRKVFERFLNEQAKMFRGWFQDQLKTLTRIKPVRGKVPLDLRYEWAVQRHYFGKQYKDIASGKYSSEVVRKTVTAILRDVGLSDRK